MSKVEPDVLLGDFLIQPWNSGGPLVNLQGQVVGINTFGEGRTSGAVRIARLRDDLCLLVPAQLGDAAGVVGAAELSPATTD